MSNEPPINSGEFLQNVGDFLNKLNNIRAEINDSNNPAPDSEPKSESAKAEASNFEKQGDKYQKQLAKLRNKHYKASLKSYKQNIRERKEYASKIFWLVAFWLLITAIITVACAIQRATLSDAVLIALMTTASANVIAIFLYVTRYLFNHKDDPII